MEEHPPFADQYDTDNCLAQVDPATKTALPWLCQDYQYGVCTNHAAVQNMTMYDERVFLSGYNSGRNRIDHHSLRMFRDAFPKFSSEYGKNFGQHLLSYLDQIVIHGNTLGIFICPTQCYTEGDPMGPWFHKLNAAAQSDAVLRSGPAILNSLLNEKNGLLKYSELKDILQNNTDGCKAMYDLAVYAGHPRLIKRTPMPQEPFQKSSQDYIAYYGALQRYARKLLCQGTPPLLQIA